MVIEVVEKVSVAIPVSKPSVPLSVPTKLPAPAGETWMMFKVKFPPMAGPVEPGGTVLETTMSPKLVPAGVFTELVVALKVSVVDPLMFVKTATFVPLTLNTPVVLKVTGSAFASAVPRATITASRATITEVLNRLPIDLFPL